MEDQAKKSPQIVFLGANIPALSTALQAKQQNRQLKILMYSTPLTLALSLSDQHKDLLHKAQQQGIILRPMGKLSPAAIAHQHPKTVFFIHEIPDFFSKAPRRLPSTLQMEYEVQSATRPLVRFEEQLPILAKIAPSKIHEQIYPRKIIGKSRVELEIWLSKPLPTPLITRLSQTKPFHWDVEADRALLPSKIENSLAVWLVERSERIRETPIPMSTRLSLLPSRYGAPLAHLSSKDGMQHHFLLSNHAFAFPHDQTLENLLEAGETLATLLREQPHRAPEAMARAYMDKIDHIQSEAHWHA